MNNPTDFTIEKISSILGMPVDVILELAEDAPFLYRKTKILKNEKEFRKLEIPHPILKKFQGRVLHEIFDKFNIHPCLYGGQGSSSKKAVFSHIRKPIVITMDIMNFFPSVKTIHVIRAFKTFGIEEDLAITLSRLVTCDNHLPQGAPTSPFIGRIVLNQFAFELGKMLKKVHMNATFSIYVDDIIISGPEGMKRLVPTVERMLFRHGYKIRKEKTRIMYKDDEQISLNIRLNNRIEATSKFLVEIEELGKRLPPWDPRILGKKAYVEYLLKPESVLVR